MSLKTELVGGHPDTGVYNADPLIASQQLNAKNRPRNKKIMSGSEIMNAIDNGEFTALSVSDQQMIWNILHLGNINPFGLEATLFINIFGASTTITTLQVLRVELISRVQELDLPFAKPGHVIEARM